MEGIVLERVGTLGLFCPKLGQGFRPSVAALYPNVGQVNVMHGEVKRIFFMGQGGILNLQFWYFRGLKFWSVFLGGTGILENFFF